MIHGYVPTNKVKVRWQDHIKTQSQYNICVGSGICWVVYPDIPLSWAECVELLKLEEKEDE